MNADESFSRDWRLSANTGSYSARYPRRQQLGFYLVELNLGDFDDAATDTETGALQYAAQVRESQQHAASVLIARNFPCPVQCSPFLVIFEHYGAMILGG